MVRELCEKARKAEKFLCSAEEEMKNKALLFMSKGLIDDS